MASESHLTSEQVVRFFKSWGMYPSLEDTDDYNSSVIDQGINTACYNKLIREASKLDNKLRVFCARQINCQDDAWYLRADTWHELLEAWNHSTKL